MARLYAITDDGLLESEDFQGGDMGFSGDGFHRKDRGYGDVVLERYEKGFQGPVMWSFLAEKFAKNYNYSYGKHYTGKVENTGKRTLDLYFDEGKGTSDAEHVANPPQDPNERFYTDKAFIFNLSSKSVKIRDICGRSIAMKPQGYCVFCDNNLTKEGVARSRDITYTKPRIMIDPPFEAGKSPEREDGNDRGGME